MVGPECIADAQEVRPRRRAATPPGVPDVYVTCHGSVGQWGGGRAVALHVQNALDALDVATRLVGISPCAARARGDEPAFDLRVRVPRTLWRFHNWLVSRSIAAALRALPRPRRGLVAISAAWADAARRVWPDVPIVIPFCCALTNCLPFAWEGRRAPTFWAQVDWLGIRRTERRGFRAADRIIVPTRQAREELVALDPVLGSRTFVRSFGYRARPADPAVRVRVRHELGVSPQDVLFLFGGVCDLNKSPAWIAREFLNADGRAHLVIVGKGPALAGVPRSPRVHTVGDHPDCNDWIAAADVVVSGSWYDTLPNILKEGVEASRPIIAPFSRPPRTFGGFDEIIHESGCGLCFDRGEDGALTAVIDRLVCDVELRSRLAERAARLVAQRSGWAEVGQCALESFGESVPNPRDGTG